MWKYINLDLLLIIVKDCLCFLIVVLAICLIVLILLQRGEEGVFTRASNKNFQADNKKLRKRTIQVSAIMVIIIFLTPLLYLKRNNLQAIPISNTQKDSNILVKS